jgi:hypothetical protein
MSRPLIRVTSVLALATIGTCLLPGPSHAEKMSPGALRQLCNTAGGTFFKAPSGKYVCNFPSFFDPFINRRAATTLICDSRGQCERSRSCIIRDCPYPDKGGTKKPGTKPTKLEGALTAGTADQRGAGVSSGPTAGALNPNLGAGSAPTNSGLTGSTGAALGTPVAPTKDSIGIGKPFAIPAQLADRLRRLQQQR